MLTRLYNSSREGFEYDDADHAEKDEICMVAPPEFEYLGKISIMWCRNQFMRPICKYVT